MKKTVMINFRASVRQKEAMAKVAEERDQSLSEFIRDLFRRHQEETEHE